MIDDAQLWLLRHGAADGKFDAAGERVDAATDYKRTLTAKGAKQAIRAGEVFKALAPPPAAIYTSPMTRCLQSAQLVCAAFGPKVLPTRKPELIDTPTRHPNVAVGLAQDGKAVLLVGHGPEWDAVIKHATGRDVHMSRGALAAIHFSKGQGTLAQLLQPSDIKSMV